MANGPPNFKVAFVSFFSSFFVENDIDYNILEGNESFTFILSVKANGNGITFAPGQIAGIYCTHKGSMFVNST